MDCFDSLVHATPDGRWLGGDRHDAGLLRLIGEMDAAGVSRACLVGLANWIENDFVLTSARKHSDRLIPVAGFDPSRELKDAIPAALRAIRDQGFQGVKLHPRLNGYHPLDERCLDAIQVAGELGLPVFLDTLFRNNRLPVASPVDVIDHILKRAAHVKLILLHGAGSEILDLFELGRMSPNVLIDASCTLLRYAGSSLDQDLKFLFSHLDQRVVIGSDFPEYTPAAMLRRFDELSVGLSDEKRRNIRYENLSRWFSNGTR